MGDQKMFRMTNKGAEPIEGWNSPLERPVQKLLQANLYPIFGVHFLATEFSTGKQHRGRIDALGIDENGCPVIFEFKAHRDENVMNQGLYYLDWLMDHRGDFKSLVRECLEKGLVPKRFQEMEIDFEGTRIMCIAGDFTKFDAHAASQIRRNIELIRYTMFGGDLILFELINSDSAQRTTPKTAQSMTDERITDRPSRRTKPMSAQLEQAAPELKQLYSELEETLLGQGDDTKVKENYDYHAFVRLKNFACVEVRPKDARLLLFLKVDPGSVELTDGFARDVRKIGHFGTGDLEVTIRSSSDIAKALPWIQESYQAN